MHHLLKQITGHQRVKELLSGFLNSGRMPPALLFSGIDGIGKDYLAFQFSQAVNSTTDTEQKSSDTINLKIKNLEEPYIKYIIPLPRARNESDDTGPTEKFTEDEIESLRIELRNKIENPYHKISLQKANNIKVSSIRDIKKFLTLDFSDIKYRVIIISNAHYMNDEAQNALLKSLEEPPDNVIFILTTSQPYRLRETILSRCWRITLDPLSNQDLQEILSEYFKIDSHTAEAIAPFADGSIQTAIKLNEMGFNKLIESVISVLRYSFGRKFHSAYDELNKIIDDAPTENLPVIIKLILIWINDLNRFRFNIQNQFYKNHGDTLQKFQAKFPDRELKTLMFELDSFSTLIRQNINSNLICSNLVFQLSNIVTAEPS